jgi:methylmalonyl-CoA/ethylmalonyl-CoA epimerase
MRFHHVGCAVKSIEAALPAYRPMFPNIGEPILVSSQKVRVCFIEMRPGCYLELVEPAGEDSAVSVFLRKGVSYYHNGFLVDDFDATAAQLLAEGCRPMEVFHSEAFGGRRCQFFMNPAFHWIEIIESDNVDILKPESR